MLNLWGTAAAAPLPSGLVTLPSVGAVPLVTPYYCRLGDLLRLFCVYRFLCALLSTYLYLVVFVVFFVFCRSSFSTLILLVGSFDL